MILEGVLTTIDVDGQPHIAPMGPIVDPSMQSCVLRPYQTSSTYKNLKRHGEAVFHVVDDVGLIAQAAVGRLAQLPPLRPATSVQGWILNDACRWYALRVRSLDDAQPRTSIILDVLESGWQRDFFGFNRGKHAVLEAAILATRLEFLAADDIRREVARLQVLVDKTGGPQERSAFTFLSDYVREALGVVGAADLAG